MKKHFKKKHSKLEYLVKYGWVFLLIIIVGIVLFVLSLSGYLSGNQSRCSFYEYETATENVSCVDEISRCHCYVTLNQYGNRSGLTEWYHDIPEGV